jgi:CRP/FNR family transcriptional regulator, cyclic AMP receptor protein
MVVTPGTFVTGSFLGAGVFSAWLVPAIFFVVIIGVSWLGLRWIRSEHVEALRAVPLFSLLSERELRAVLRSAHPVAFPPGTTVIEQGKRAGGFFVITDGTANVGRDGADLATLGSGSYFGEMAVIDGGPRTATITARTQVSTLEISPTAFLHLVDREPMIAQGIYEELARRLKAAGHEVVEGSVARVDRARLTELCQTLRQTQGTDWVQATPTRQRMLRLSNLFARGA